MRASIFPVSTLYEDPVRDLLAAKVRARFEEAGRGYARWLDKEIGKEGQGWTSKLLNGTAPIPTIETLLRVLRALALPPTQFFAELQTLLGWADTNGRPLDGAIEASNQSMPAIHRSVEEYLEKHLQDIVRAELDRRERGG